MPLADTKLAQTILDLWWLEVAKPILEANAKVADIRAAIEANGLAGQFTAGELDAMLAVESDLGGLAALVGVTAAQGKYRSGHSTEPATVGLEA